VPHILLPFSFLDCFPLVTTVYICAYFASLLLVSAFAFISFRLLTSIFTRAHDLAV
jgi:hypothetical protein